jgi:copper(I)-binding protein
VIARRVVPAAVAATVVLSLSACGLESKDDTSKERSQVQAATFAVGAVQVRDAFVTYPDTDPTTPYVVATFVNNGSAPDVLTGATSPAGSISVITGSATAAGVQLPPGVVVQVVDPSLGSGTLLELKPTGAAPKVGTTVPVTFSFSDGGSQSAQLPVTSPGFTTNPTVTIPPTVAPQPSASGERASD